MDLPSNHIGSGDEAIRPDRPELAPEIAEVRMLMEMAEVLGFKPTSEMMSLRDQIANISQSTDVEHAFPLVAEYRRLSEELIDSMPDVTPGDRRRHATAQIGRDIAVAAIWHQAGEDDRAVEDLTMAAMYAGNLDADHVNMEEIRQELQRLVSAIETRIEQKMKIEGERVSSSREKLIQAASEVLGSDVVEGLLTHDLDDEDLWMAVYAELVSAGFEDPDTFFIENG